MKVNDILNIKESYQAPQRIMDILYGDIEERDEVFKQFLEAYDYDVSYDWFHEYFQDEHADRKKHNSVSKLLVNMVGNSSNYYEPACGTGGIIIQKWEQDRMEHSPFDYLPSMYFYTGEELSERAIPFLLFNMIIRGMNGVVAHCDVLTREAYGAWFIQNDTDNHLGFSSLNLLPYNESIERELNVKFIDHKYKEIKQTKETPKHLLNSMVD